MEEKTAKNSYSIRSIFSTRIFNKLFLRSKNSSVGFTLIELVVVISLIGILATTLIVLINPKFQIQRANDGKRKADLKQIQAGLEIYRADLGGYPLTLGTSLTNGTTTYIASVPKDPKGGNYYFCTTNTCDASLAACSTAPCPAYSIFSCLENANDSDKMASAPLAVVTNALACPTSSDGVNKYYYKVLNP